MYLCLTKIDIKINRIDIHSQKFIQVKFTEKIKKTHSNLPQRLKWVKSGYFQ